jgi:hypothetical protein
MTQIAIEVQDDQKAKLLIELLTALDFVTAVEVHERNGASLETEAEQSIFYRDPRQPLMVREEVAFEEMHQQLIEQYLGSYVAVHAGQVVDCDSDEVTLVERTRVNYPDDIVLIRQVEKTLPPPLTEAILGRDVLNHLIVTLDGISSVTEIS